MGLCMASSRVLLGLGTVGLRTVLTLNSRAAPLLIPYLSSI